MAFVIYQLTALPYPTHSWEGQTVIVTGSNTGLGLEAARHFARLDAAKVILACRSASKGAAALKDIEKTTGRIGVCEVWELDLSNFNSVKSFCKRVEALDRLDVVVENAGIAKSEYIEAEGMELTIAVNVVGTFLLALNVLPVLKRTAEKYGTKTNLVVVSSETHSWTKMPERLEPSIFEALKKNDAAYMADRYPTSKLLEVFIVRSLGAKISSGLYAGQPVILNCLAPGLCHSELTRDFTGLQGWLVWAFKAVLARTTEKGSRTLVASASAGIESHGCYMTNCKVAEPSDFVKSEDGKKTQERVYTELMGVLEGIQPGITKDFVN